MSAAPLQDATFRLETPDGALAGTAVLVGRQGVFLTCHHVVARGTSLTAADRAGNRFAVTWQTAGDEVLAQCDLAIIRVEDQNLRFPSAAPLLMAPLRGTFHTRVQLREGKAFLESVPLPGSFQGDTKIRYVHGDRTYQITGSLLTGFHVRGGMSGAPIWDERLGAVVGLIAVGTEEDGDIGGFASSFLQAAVSNALAAVLLDNEATVPRFGEKPNRLGTAAILKSATEATLQRMRDRAIIQMEEGVVPREGFREALEAFRESSFAAFPIISAAGQGKTTLLANLAMQSANQPTWLVRGADFPEKEPPSAALWNMLTALRLVPHESGIDCLSQYSDPRPVLLLDGLNEVPLAPRVIADEWLPDLIGAIKRSGWRVIFTTRRELFFRISAKGVLLEDFFQPGARGNDEPDSWFQLGPFTPEEAEAAAQAYDLPAELTRTIGRQPLMFRLAARGGGNRHRADVFTRYLAELIDEAKARLDGLHPAEIRNHLIDIAEAAAQEPSGTLAFDNPAVRDRSVTAALCTANVLEEVDAGYRIIFDEVSDFLLAVRLAETDPSGWPDEPVNVVTLAIELLFQKDPVSAVRTAQHVAVDTPFENFKVLLNAFRTICGLERRAEFDAVKVGTAERVAESQFLRFVLSLESDLPGALPLEALIPILKAAILQEEGYGWREKDIYSKFHRATTEVIARTQRGLTRLVDDLVREATIDGTAVLINLLGDATALSHHGESSASSEATIGSFAVCMLFAHRERVGAARIFREVIFQGLPGGTSLLEAFCEDEPQLVADYLDEAGSPDGTTSPGLLRRAWTTLLAKAGDRLDIRQRIAGGLKVLLPRLNLIEQQEVFLSAAPNSLLEKEELRSLYDRIIQPETLHQRTLLTGFKAGIETLDHAVAIAARHGLDKRFVHDLAYFWDSGDPQPPLIELMALVRRHFPADEDPSMDRRHIIEMLSYAVTLEEAETSGFRGYLEDIIEQGAKDDLEILTYPAFSATGRSAGHGIFRDWLGRHLSIAPNAASIAPLALERAMSMEPLSNRVPPTVPIFAQMVEPGNLFWLAVNEYDPDRVRTLLNIVHENVRRRGGDTDFIRGLVAIFEEPGLSASDREAKALDHFLSLTLRR